MKNKKIMLILLLMIFSSDLAAVPILYSDRSDYLNSVGTTITDTYDSPGYLHGDVWDLDYVDVHSDSSMNNVFGETQYQSTGVANHNFVSSWINTAYCEGCNVSYQMSFLDTSLSTNDGIYGVGFDALGITWSGTKAVYAFVEFGDFSYQSYWLDEFSFWGITSDLGIRTIHIGLEDGSPTLNASIGIDNLTIATAVPEPSVAILLIIGLFAIFFQKARYKNPHKNV